MIHDVTIGTKTAKSYGFTLESVDLGSPTLQSSYVIVPGRNGVLDYTEAVAGYPTYTTRKITFTLVKEGDIDSIETARNAFYKDVHGKRLKFTPDWTTGYYTGRYTVSTAAYRPNFIRLAVDIEADPYRYALAPTTVSLSSGRNTVTNGGALPVVPTITTETEALITFGGKTYAVDPGTSTVPGLVLQPGNNTIRLASLEPYSGSIVTLNRPTNITDVVVDISAVQGGTGTPAMDNIRVITGYTRERVVRTAKNIAILSADIRGADTSDRGITYHMTSNSSFSVSGTCTANYSHLTRNFEQSNLNLLPAGTYTITIWRSGTVSGTVELKGYAKGQSTAARIVAPAQWGTPQSFTTTESMYYAINMQIAGDVTVDGEVTVQVEVGEGTAFEARRSNTYITNFGRTVGKGSINFTTGELTITHKIITFNGSENWALSPSGGVNRSYLGGNAMRELMPDLKSGTHTTDITFNMFNGSSSAAVGNAYISSYPNLICCHGMTNDDWKAFLQTNNLQLLYPLEVPETHKLTGRNIPTISNSVNNVYAETGDISLKAAISGQGSATLTFTEVNY